MNKPQNRQLSGQFLNANNINVGSIPTAGFNVVDIALKAYQENANVKTNQVGLDIYYSNHPLQNFTGGVPNTNLDEAQLYKSVNVNSSVDGDPCYYNHSIRVNGSMPYITIVLRNPQGIVNGDLYFDLYLNSHNNAVDNYVVRDAIIHEEDEALVVRNAVDFHMDTQDGNLDGVETWGMNCKGALTNTEFLVQDETSPSSGYFKSNNLHSAESLRLKSGSGLDVVGGGVGAGSIRIHGLDSNLKRQFTDVNLNGTTEVQVLAPLYTEVNSAEILSAGSLYCNAGTINIYNADGGDTKTMCAIALNHGKSNNPQFCVPKDYVLLVSKISVSTHMEDEGELFFNYYEWTDTPQILKKRLQSFHLNSNENFSHEVEWVLTEGQRLTITGQTAVVPTGTNKVSVSVVGYLKKANLGASSNKTYTSNTNVKTSQY